MYKKLIRLDICYMQAKSEVNLKDYKDLIETIAKVEYQKISAQHLVEYLELVNIGTHALYILFKSNNPKNFNNSYLSTAIKWSIRNEVRRRYKWYSMKQKRDIMEDSDGVREAMYKTILSVDEMADAENPTIIRSTDRSPEEMLMFTQLKSKVEALMETLP